VERMPPELGAVFHEFEAFGTASFFNYAVISSPGFGTFEPDIFTHKAPRREKKAA